MYVVLVLIMLFLLMFNLDVIYTGYAGCHITAGIPVKFGTAHGGSRPEVGSAKRIDVYGSEGLSRPCRIFSESEGNIIIHTDSLRPKHNFSSLTV